MENILVVNSIVAAGTKSHTALDAADARGLLVIADNTTQSATTLGNIPIVHFSTKLTSGKFRSSVPIRRADITSITYQPYVAPVLSVDRIGEATGTGTLACEELKEASITVRNMSYIVNSPTQRINVSKTRRTGEALATFLGRIVTELNNVTTQGVPFFTAALVTNTTYYAITITALDRNVDISISTDGEFAYQTVTRTTEPVVGFGVGADIVALEKERSRHLGNHGYVELTELWYNAPTEALASENYGVFNISWTGKAGTPTSTMNVAENVLSIAVPSGSTAVIASLENILQAMASSVYNVQIIEDVVEDVANTSEILNP